MSKSEEISFQSGDVFLVGMLVSTQPEKNSVTVLMIHGSGPLDRDYNMKRQKLDVFNTLAEQFESAGVASFRYDKRGCGASGGDFFSAGFGDLIKDARAAVDLLSSRSDTGRIILLGHSEGTMIAPVIAHLKPEVDGLILLCPTVQPVEETLLLQAERVTEMIDELSGIRGLFARGYSRIVGGMTNSQTKLIEKIKITHLKTVRSMGMKVPVNWMRELLAHNPTEWMQKVSVPVLTISGEKDVQCLPQDSDRIAGLVQGPVEAHCLDNLTHILRTDEEAASFLQYEKIMENDIDPRIMTLCLEWLSQRDFVRRDGF